MSNFRFHENSTFTFHKFRISDFTKSKFRISWNLKFKISKQKSELQISRKFDFHTSWISIFKRHKFKRHKSQTSYIPNVFNFKIHMSRNFQISDFIKFEFQISRIPHLNFQEISNSRFLNKNTNYRFHEISNFRFHGFQISNVINFKRQKFQAS